MQSIKNLIKIKQFTPDFRNKHEFQAYANRLAEELGDITHRALYMRVVKLHPRGRIEAAKDFALGYEKEKNKGNEIRKRMK